MAFELGNRSSAVQKGQGGSMTRVVVVSVCAILLGCGESSNGATCSFTQGSKPCPAGTDCDAETHKCVAASGCDHETYGNGVCSPYMCEDREGGSSFRCVKNCAVFGGQEIFPPFAMSSLELDG